MTNYLPRGINYWKPVLNHFKIVSPSWSLISLVKVYRDSTWTPCSCNITVTSLQEDKCLFAKARMSSRKTSYPPAVIRKRSITRGASRNHSIDDRLGSMYERSSRGTGFTIFKPQSQSAFLLTRSFLSLVSKLPPSLPLGITHGEIRKAPLTGRCSPANDEARGDNGIDGNGCRAWDNTWRTRLPPADSPAIWRFSGASPDANRNAIASFAWRSGIGKWAWGASAKLNDVSQMKTKTRRITYNNRERRRLRQQYLHQAVF